MGVKAMAQSQNTKVDFTIKATSMMGLTTYGDVMIGDKAFEFYNEKNVQDYIQIPYEEIDRIEASVLFHKKISRFVIFTKDNMHFTFSTRDNIKTLREVKKYVSEDKLLRSLNFFDVIKRGIKRLLRKK